MIDILFELDKETKRTHRFAEVEASILGEEPDPELGDVCGTIYIQKWVLRTLAKHQGTATLPTRIRVSIEVDPGC